MERYGCFVFMNMSASVTTRQSEEITLTSKVMRLKFMFPNQMRNTQNGQTPVVTACIIILNANLTENYTCNIDSMLL